MQYRYAEREDYSYLASGNVLKKDMSAGKQADKDIFDNLFLAHKIFVYTSS